MDQSDLDLLQTVPPYHLQSVIKMRHVPVSPRTQQGSSSPGTPLTSSPTSSNTPEIARHLFDPASIADALHSLGELEIQIIRELVACGGRANSRDLALYFTEAGLLATGKKAEIEAHETLDTVRSSPVSTIIQPPQYPPAHPHGVFEQALRRLLVMGLLFWGRQTNFAGRDYTSGVHDGVLIVPIAVREVVREELAAQTSVLAGHNDVDAGDRARALQRALYLYWSLVASNREGLALINNGQLSRSALRQVVEYMGIKTRAEQIRVENDTPYLLFIRLLLMKLGLLRERGNSLFAAPPELFFSLPLTERARRCYQIYQETPFWNEMLYLPEINVRPGPTAFEPAHEEVLRSRQVVIERVLRESVEEWRTLSALIARVKLYVPYLLFPRQYGPRAERYSSNSNPYGWDFRLKRGWLTHREGWHMVEGGFIRAVVAGPLSWLGLVDLDREENASEFRLREGAAPIVSISSPENAEVPWGRLIIQPNFELVALAPVSEMLLITLDRFAERISLEHIAQYRLTRASVTRAIQRGLRAEDIQAALESASQGEVPQNIRYSLVEWERQARRIEVWQKAVLLEVDDTALLDELFNDAETRSLFGRRLAPQLAEVAPQQLAAVQNLLWQRNYLPALTAAPTEEQIAENGHPPAREAQWRLHDDGLLQPLFAVPDLYLTAEVEQFSERDEATGWHQLAPASLRRALEGGIPLDYILRFLQQYCENGISGSLLIRLKLWGDGYGEKQDLYIEHAPLLRLPEQVLWDLLADEELKSLLGSEVEQPSRLVRIEARNLERVVALLRERGFPVND